MTAHENINREQIPYMFSGPDRTDQIRERLNAERTAARELKDSWGKHTAERNAELLAAELEKSQRNDQARAQLHASIEAQHKAKRDTVEETRRSALVDQLRAVYTAQPGVNEQDFEAALPELLKRRAEDAALAGESEFQLPDGSGKGVRKICVMSSDPLEVEVA